MAHVQWLILTIAEQLLVIQSHSSKFASTYG